MTRLGRYLEEHGISRYRLSKMTGIDIRTVSRLCEGRSGGRMDTWRLIAEKLGCQVSEIVG
jgi:DNA-binding Xre family transcriptional regulator